MNLYILLLPRKINKLYFLIRWIYTYNFVYPLENVPCSNPRGSLRKLHSRIANIRDDRNRSRLSRANVVACSVTTYAKKRVKLTGRYRHLHHEHLLLLDLELAVHRGAVLGHGGFSRQRTRSRTRSSAVSSSIYLESRYRQTKRRANLSSKTRAAFSVALLRTRSNSRHLAANT